MGSTIAELPLTHIVPSVNNPRKTFNGIEELASSIEANGLLQPITVRPHDDGYQVVAGERRFRAVSRLGWQTIPAIIREIADDDVFEIALLENIARQDMNALEEAQALQTLLDNGMEAKEIERRLGFGSGDGGEVRYKTRILGCIDSVQHLIKRGSFPIPMAVQLSRLTTDGQVKVLREYQGKALTQNAFTTLVEVIHMAENQIDMFPETKLDETTLDGARRFRKALDGLVRDATAIANISPDILGKALGHDVLIEAQIEAAIQTLVRARRAVQREQGRQHGLSLEEPA